MKTKELAIVSLPGIFSQKGTHALKHLPASQDGDEHLDFTKIIHKNYFMQQEVVKKRGKLLKPCVYIIDIIYMYINCVLT